jgi:putative endopeptidase
MTRSRSRPPARLSPSLAVVAALVLVAAFAGEAAPTTGAPAGIDTAGMDRSVKPGDNFFQYANGGWVKSTEIPADRSAWGAFSALREEADRQTSGLLEEAAKGSAATGSNQRKAGDYYATYRDEAAIDAKGVAPLRPVLERIAAVKDKKELATLLGEELRADVDPLNNNLFHTDRLFGLWVSPGFDTPGRNGAYLMQGGLGMPDRAYYLDESARMADLRSKYQAHVAAILSLAGIADAPAKAASIVALETKIARTHATRDESVDVLKANNPWKRVDFSAQAPGLDWAAYFQAAGLATQETLIVWQPGAAKGEAALVASEPLGTWKDYLAFHAIDRRGRVLPAAFRTQWFDFHERALNGVPQAPKRWKTAVTATGDALGDAVGQLFVKKYFPPESKAQVQAMVKNIIAAFDQRIDRLEWMSGPTKVKAKEKLTTLNIGVGYPDRWVDYSGLTVVRGDALGNLDRSELFAYRRRLGQLGKPRDVTEWWMTPQTVNAVNLPLQNAMNFPAAILRPPFFDPAGPAAVNYGAIGAVIGHEVSHSFDDQGAQFDAQGRLFDWWTPEDLAHFKAAAARLVAQFDAYHPFPDLAVNGKLTLSENIADNAGVAAAHDAWLLSLGSKDAPKVQGLTGAQQFFLANGQIWRAKMREAALRRRVLTDGHAPAEYRADAVRNADAWYPAFDVQPGQTLYLAPADRVRMW